jgi:hypothetical protein
MRNKLPKNWNEVTLYQYQELLSINNSEYESDIDILLDKISILTGIDIDDDEFIAMNFDDLIDILRNVSWIETEPPNNFVSRYYKFEIKDINKIKLGEFIDIEALAEDGYIKNLHIICSILYKQYKIDEWGNKIEEPYIYDIYDRANIFSEAPIGNIWGVLKHYLDFKNNLINKYYILFNNESFELEDTEGLTPEEIEDIKKEIEEDKKKSKWSWMSLINKLSNGDITKYDKITDLPLLLIFNELIMRKEMNI